MQRSLKHTLTLWTSYHMSFYFYSLNELKQLLFFFPPRGIV